MTSPPSSQPGRARRIAAGTIDELAPGQRKLVFADGRGIVLINVDGAIHAIDDACPHNGASLAGGKLDGSLLHCPAHGLRFDLKTGCTPGAHAICLKTFPVRIVERKLEIVLEAAG
jgi:3-phenylpropionate/trans-cinnamate dioxygenase ferredoxin subunit